MRVDTPSPAIRSQSRWRAGFALLLSTAAVACAGDARRPAQAPLPSAEPRPRATEATETPSATASAVRLSPDIQKACGISDTDAHFEFDSARVRDRDYPVLNKLVECFTSGPLAQKQMRLVGHADPRGDEEYNLVLGEHRADGIKQFLVNHGLSQRQATTTSRGELEARGTDEASWAEDRRVDILLAD